MEIKKLSLILENCDVIEFKGSDIGSFFVDDIKKGIYRVAANSINEMEIAQTTMVEISKNARDVHYQFGAKDDAVDNFERILNIPDITKIEIIFNDNGQEIYREFYPKWEDALYSAEANRLQESFISKKGNLFIYIGEKTDNKLFSCFENDVIRF